MEDKMCQSGVRMVAMEACVRIKLPAIRDSHLWGIKHVKRALSDLIKRIFAAKSKISQYIFPRTRNFEVTRP